MKKEQAQTVTVETTIKTSLDKAWLLWITPEHIVKWNYVLHGWNTILAKNDLREGEKFLYRLETEGGKMNTEISGVYNEIKAKELIVYTTEDGRNVKITFTSHGTSVKVSETFEPENSLPLEAQLSNSQALLDNFKNYVETQRAVFGIIQD